MTLTIAFLLTLLVIPAGAAPIDSPVPFIVRTAHVELDPEIDIDAPRKCPLVRVMTPWGPVIRERCNARRVNLPMRSTPDGNSVTYIATPRFEVP